MWREDCARDCSFVGHLAFLVKGVARRILFTRDPVVDPYLLVLAGLGTITFEGPGHRHGALSHWLWPPV